MSIDPEKFQAARPWLYHLTAQANVARLRQSRRLLCAAELLRQAGRPEQSSQRRAGLPAIQIADEASQVILRDQDPLDERYIDFESGWDLARLVELLNRRVFFWPGKAEGPDKYGQNHFRRYENSGEEVAILRVPTASLLRQNPDAPPQFCKYNSGAPGSRDGRKIPRGSDTFQEAAGCSFSLGQVREVTFVGGVALPADTQIRAGRSRTSWSLF